MKKKATFYVAECSEFPSMGQFYESIETIEEAIKKYHSIDPVRIYGIPCIGICFHEPGAEDYMDDKSDLLIAGRLKLNNLGLFLGSENVKNPKLLEAIEVLKKEFPQKGDLLMTRAQIREKYGLVMLEDSRSANKELSEEDATAYDKFCQMIVANFDDYKADDGSDDPDDISESDYELIRDIANQSLN